MIENITSSEYLHKSEFRMCCGQREVIQTIYRFKTVLWANTWDMLKTFFWRHWTKIYLWGILYTPYYINTPQKRFHIEKYPTDWNISIYITHIFIYSGKHQVFHFETKNELAWSVLQDANGRNFKGVVQRVKKVPDFFKGVYILKFWP